ncbi:arsenite methyltransferase [Fibrella forsythiae]|uniref:Arsenite methyltransferase n=1 Tax=Fibrella forsythiae TaxID=2817061 RepID=A0ABS3JIN3_9BACT|nr:arsenite methyltransferase [Fibrella forsythiae]MBO0949863.1 arsenite methyltransferase [Fibrella forsythiae]
MKTDNQLKELVRETYTTVADQSREMNAASCCGVGGCSPLDDAAIMADDYSHLAGYVPDADLGLGCGLPTQFAQIKPGDTVIDLGSGAGNDCFVARHETGPTGKVIGIDFTPAMIDRACRNADMLGYNNVEFRAGDIEQMPVADNVADVVVSNCVLNLVPNKANVLAEIARVLKPGGHFSISDIVLQGDLPQGLRQAAEMYAGCVSGAIQHDEYLRLIQEAGFAQITIQKRKAINLPDSILDNYLTVNEIAIYRQGGVGIMSVTVYAEKPGAVNSVESTAKPKIKLTDLTNSSAQACTPGGGCC